VTAHEDMHIKEVNAPRNKELKTIVLGNRVGEHIKRVNALRNRERERIIAKK
jgi:hypothetical protein